MITIHPDLIEWKSDQPFSIVRARFDDCNLSYEFNGNSGIEIHTLRLRSEQKIHEIVVSQYGIVHIMSSQPLHSELRIQGFHYGCVKISSLYDNRIERLHCVLNNSSRIFAPLSCQFGTVSKIYARLEDSSAMSGLTCWRNLEVVNSSSEVISFYKGPWCVLNTQGNVKLVNRF